MLEWFYLLTFFGVIVSFWFYLRSKRNNKENIVVPQIWKSFFESKIVFYRNLNDQDKFRFENDVYRFLRHVPVNGAKDVEVTLEDRLYVACSAVIPLFGFPHWTYHHLNEVILYPSSFDRNFNLANKEEIITGMVGSGIMEGKVILSIPALRIGFENSKDKKNVGIHEFVHLFDKADGLIDGNIAHFEGKDFALPWLDFVRVKIKEIHSNESDIDDYGGTKPEEFFAVASEYFFESPHLMKKNHPDLYQALSEIFQQDTASMLTEVELPKAVEVGRNAFCPCGSGKKYKKCCLR